MINSRLEGNDMLMGAFISALSKNYPETAKRCKEIYEKQRVVIEAETITKEQ